MRIIKNIDIFFLFSILFSLNHAFDPISIINKMKDHSVSFDSFKSEVSSGRMNGFLTINEGYSFLSLLSTEFPQLIFNQTIGNTYEGQNITVFGITNLTKNKHNIDTLPSMLFTGLHHAREPLSYTMNLYLIVNILTKSLRNDTETNEILEQSLLWLIPALNLDGYRRITEIYEKTGQLDENIRKNRRPQTSANCKDEDIGVDLNRNYNYEFGYDNKGSSSSFCNIDYRGESAFSEPETQAVRDFAVKYQKNLKIVINFHAYGNLWITPFNYLDDKSNPNLFNFKKISVFYEEFHSKAIFSETYKFGNAAKTINYIANGEASDWFLGKLGIFTLSPELGDDSRSSNNFYPPQKTILSIIENCFPPIDFLMNKMKFSSNYLLLNQTSNNQSLTLSSQTENLDSIIAKIQLFNDAMIDYEIHSLKIILKSTKNEVLPLKTNGIRYSMADDEKLIGLNQSFHENSSINFNGRSYLNLSIIFSKKEINEIMSKNSLQELIVLILNDYHEIKINNVEFLKINTNNEESDKSWTWFLVGLSIFILCVIIIYIVRIFVKRNRNFFGKMNISEAEGGFKGDVSLTLGNKANFSNFIKEDEV